MPDVELSDRLAARGIENGAQANVALASQAEAEAGTENTKTMTALRVAQAIAALAGEGSFKVDGSVDMTGQFKTDVGTFASDVANGASAVGFLFNTTNTFSTAGAKIASFSNNGVEKVFFNKDGQAYFGVGAGRGAIQIGNDGTDAMIKKNESSTGWLVLDSNNAAISLQTGTNNTGVQIGAGTSAQEHVRIIPSTYTISLLHYLADFTLKSSRRSGDETTRNFAIKAQEAWASATTNIVGGDLQLAGGAGASGSVGNAHGGNVTISGGAKYGTGHKGYIILDLASLPTSDPSVNGALWLDSGTLSVSGA